ncbi:TPA: replication initiation protein, partial [Streptococcus agalactiae]
MELKVSLDNITITAYIKSYKLLGLKRLVEGHTAIII